MTALTPHPSLRYGPQIATDGRRWYLAGHRTAHDAYSGQPRVWIPVSRWHLLRRWECWRDRRWAIQVTRA